MEVINKTGEVKVTYCGGWGYGGRFNNLKRTLAPYFPEVKFVPERRK